MEDNFDIIYVGKTIHQWLVLAGPFQKHNRCKHWQCMCICGNIKDVSDYNLRNDKSHNCGCTRILSEETRKSLAAKRKAQPPPVPKGTKRSPEAVAKMIETKRINKLKREGLL